MSRSSSADASFTYWKADCLSRQPQLGGWVMGLRPHFYQSSERHRPDPRGRSVPPSPIARGGQSGTCRHSGDMLGDARTCVGWNAGHRRHLPVHRRVQDLGSSDRPVPSRPQLAMAAGMTIPVVAWMLFRGMGRRNALEIAAVMVLPPVPSCAWCGSTSPGAHVRSLLLDDCGDAGAGGNVPPQVPTQWRCKPTAGGCDSCASASGAM